MNQKTNQKLNGPLIKKVRESNMARKKKTVGEDAADVISSDWPKVVKGSHLTVTTHEDGKTELVWDDEQLEKDVLSALKNTGKSKKDK